MGELLHISAFPVEVYAPDVAPVPHRCRVFITTNRIVAWEVPAGSGTPTVFLEATHTSPPERNRGSFFGQVSLDTPEAGMVYVTKGHGCACHSPLLALDPPVPW